LCDFIIRLNRMQIQRKVDVDSQTVECDPNPDIAPWKIGR
jgi:hypothetical protein